VSPFEAQQHGVCAACPEPIRPGDVIRVVDGQPVHETCVDDWPDVCPHCWLPHAGKCPS
jgi:hypothetical protein